MIGAYFYRKLTTKKIRSMEIRRKVAMSTFFSIMYTTTLSLEYIEDNRRIF